MEEKIIVLGYVRKSPDDKEGTELSIKNQTEAIEYYSKINNLELIDVYIDKNISGSDRGRKAFNNVIRKSIELKKENENVWIIVKDQNRFARDSAFFSDTLQDLIAHGVKVFSLIKNGFLSHEDLGDMVRSVVDSEDILKGRRYALFTLEKKQRESLPPFIAPFGYRNNKKTKTWNISKKESFIVKSVIEDYVSGIRWKETIEKFKINKSLYYRIISNANKGIYNGYVVYNKKFKDSNKKVIRTEEVRYKSNYSPIINEELFERCQREFQKRKEKN